MKVSPGPLSRVGPRTRFVTPQTESVRRCWALLVGCGQEQGVSQLDDVLHAVGIAHFKADHLVGFADLDIEL